MNTIGERVQIIREQADNGNKLTLEKFGKRISLTNQAVSAIEKGRVKPSNSTIDLICREFQINRIWLETGEGQMKKEIPPHDEVAELVYDVLQVGMEDPVYNFVLNFLKTYQQMNEDKRSVIRQLVKGLLEQQGDAPSTDTEE